MARLRILFLFVSLISLVLAAAPTFCKCTCFKNSTIIPLGPNHAAPPPAPKPTSTSTSASSLADQSSSPPALQNRAASSSCTQCNRAACLSYNLPFCKDAEEKDVVAMCFQRDSAKDQIIVWGFILGTGGLLGWAALKRVLEKGSGGNGTGILGSLRQRFETVATGRARGSGVGVHHRRREGNADRETERGAYSPLGTGDGAGRGSG
ncbi:hypothetical protein GE09DRAFT_1133483 [Coniochaeta sp. 2T2.1]|nr:hypothetical protein GE09DRAFT_1133483 [Coniochaeta sp. 2T2.1]